MLQSLHIQNFAIIESVDIELNPGFTAITGETGAGKSILIDAMGLVLGDRADKDQIRYGCNKADISAEFALKNPGILEWLNDNDLDDDGHCLIRRVIKTSGSAAYINGNKVPLSVLSELGSQLVEIHGQHEHQQLINADKQRQIIDGFGQLKPVTDKVASLYKQWRDAAMRLNELQNNQRERSERADYLRFQLDELEKLAPQSGEATELDQEQVKLANAEQTLNHFQQASQLLYDGDNSAYQLLTAAQQQLEPVASYDQGVNDALEMVNNAVIQAQEAADSLHRQADQVELDPARLQWVDQRLADLQGAARKHFVDSDELPNKLQSIADELEALDNAEQANSELEQQVETFFAEFDKAATKLSKQRASVAQQLNQKVIDVMRPLGLPNGEFRCDVSTKESPSAAGYDQINFLVSMNPGQPPKPLRKVASGGELSRISLAIQVVTADVVDVGTMVFDEVDSGIGGGVAEIVGKRLQNLGISRQVLSITHLPQVASCGNTHLHVQKSSDSQSTQTEIIELCGQAREEEVARMLGGVELTEQSLAHSREMLNSALGQ